jgi:hypothetical protein
LQPSSSVANIDEWRWKLNMLQRNAEEQEIISRDRRDRRDYDQIANLAKRMGLYRFCTVILITPASELPMQPLKYQCVFAVPGITVSCMGGLLLRARSRCRTTGQTWTTSVRRER